MNKKSFLLGVVLLIAGQLLTAQEWKLITLKADGAEASYAVTNVQQIVFENDLMTVELKSGNNIAGISRVSFDLGFPEADYSKLKLNEVNGYSASGDTDKFYELINIGDVEIPLAGVTIEYDGASDTGAGFPPVGGGQGVTWMGCVSQTIAPGGFFVIQDRNSSQVIDINTCATKMKTGLTAARNLIITLKDPSGNIIDQCKRAQDTDEYTLTNKSYSRIPDGTGPFYFTEATPNATNGVSTAGLTLVPQSAGTDVKSPKAEPAIFVFPNPVKNYLTVSGAAKNAKINVLESNGTLLQTVISKDKSTDIDVSSLQQGMYLLQIGNQVVKFIKQ